MAVVVAGRSIDVGMCLEHSILRTYSVNICYLRCEYGTCKWIIACISDTQHRSVLNKAKNCTFRYRSDRQTFV